MGWGIPNSRARAGAAARSYPPGDVAWIVLLPCALLLTAACALLGPPLGRWLFAPRGMAFWPFSPPAVRPEPTEHARYVLALLAPLLITAAVRSARRRDLPAWSAALIPIAQWLTLVLLAASIVSQHVISYFTPPQRWVYFTWPTLAVGAGIAALIALSLQREGLRERARALLRDTRPRRLAALAGAVLFTADWLLICFNSDGSIATAHRAVAANLGNFWLDETFSVLDGRPPLVGIHAQYSQLWPYLAAGAMKLFGASVGVWSGVMIAGTAAAMLAIFAVLRRIAGSALAALGLYVPFLATSFFMIDGPLANRFAPANQFSIFPMRCGGPYVLAWLTLRYVDGSRPRRRLLLFIVAGLVAINNVEFGIPAFAATVAAILWADGQLAPRILARLARDALFGLLAAAGLVALLTLAVAGSLPRFGWAFTYSRIYAIGGFNMLPMKAVGLHFALYATFVAAVAVASVRAMRGAERSMTAMLAWAGVFGFGAGSYFVGRSHPEVLKCVFSAWALALALLLVAVVRAILARPGRRPAAIELAVLFGFGLAICSVAQTPAPWTQIQRIEERSPAVLKSYEEVDLVAERTRRGEPVAIVAPLGHRIAYDAKVVDVTPFPEADLPAVMQLQETIVALRAAHGRKLFVADWRPHSYPLSAFTRAGFRAVDVPPELRVVELVDERAPLTRR
jgi:hypothetical protein